MVFRPGMKASATLFLRILASPLIVYMTNCASAQTSEQRERASRAEPLRSIRATYCRAPRNAENRVDTDRLIAQLLDINANTYSIFIHGWATDWDDLKLILPKARAKNIRVWASLVPPSESPPRTKMYAEPFRLDYERWAVEFAKLSLRETNLVAWSIDDFTHNLNFYTTNYLKKVVDASHRINPKLAFVPCSYFPKITPAFVAAYRPLLDGILFPYRHESGGANLKDPSLVESELKQIKAMVGPDFPVILDIYATAHSRLGATTPEYVEQAMEAGKKAADGVMIYCHQDPEKDAAKYGIIKREFGAWK